MTITSRLQQAHARLARQFPHADSLRVATISAPTEGEWGEQIPGGVTLSAPIPCHAARLNAEDAVKAGVSGIKEVWRVVTNAVTPAVSPKGTVQVTLESGQTVSLSVLSVGGTTRQVILGEVAS